MTSLLMEFVCPSHLPRHRYMPPPWSHNHKSVAMVRTSRRLDERPLGHGHRIRGCGATEDLGGQRADSREVVACRGRSQGSA